MGIKRDIHTDFLHFLAYKDEPLIDLYKDLREFVFSFASESNELLYHTHALTSVYTTSEKLGDAFCMIPIYTNHLNLGFNKGTLLKDPKGLLTGTGKLIRHIPIEKPSDYRNEAVALILQESLALSLEDMKPIDKRTSLTISKIKRSNP